VHATWSTLVFVPLVAFALYRRYKRSFGPQPLAPRRMIARVCILAAVCVFFIAWLPTVYGLAAAVAGIALGVTLAFFDLSYTTIETTEKGIFFTPNKWIGLAVVALFVGRIAARGFAIYETATALAPGESPFTGLKRSPLTLGLYFLLAGYYGAYYLGVLRKARAK
jgi:hypothetical protein